MSNYDTTTGVVQRAKCSLKDALGISLSGLPGKEEGRAKSCGASSDEEVKDASSK